MHTDRLASKVLRGMRSRAGAFADTFARELHGTDPFYEIAADDVYLARTREAALAGVHAFVRWAGGDEELTPDEDTYYREQAIDAATQLVPLEALHEPVRMGERMLWGWIVDACGPDGHDTALVLLERLRRFSARLSAVLTEAYLETRFSSGEDRQAQRDLLEELLAGRVEGRELRSRQAAAFGLDDAHACVVLVAAPRRAGGHEASDARDALDRALAVNRRLVVDRGDELVAVLPLDAGMPAFVESWKGYREHLRRGHGFDLVIGVSTSGRLRDVPDRFDEAKAALRFAATSPDGVVAIGDVRPFDYVTSRFDDTARRIVPDSIASFLHEDARLGGKLSATLLALADADLNAGRAAQTLSVHPNTVHHRLGRIAKLSGRDPKRFHDLTDLLVALRCAQPEGKHASPVEPPA